MQVGLKVTTLTFFHRRCHNTFENTVKNKRVLVLENENKAGQSFSHLDENELSIKI